MENRDRMREKGLPDLPPGKPVPGEAVREPPTDRQRSPDEDDRNNERQAPRRDPAGDQTPRMA